jgi:hypothetical protein
MSIELILIIISIIIITVAKSIDYLFYYLYLKIKHSIPYNNGKNEYSTCFSIIYFENIKEIEIYGYDTLINGEKEVFFSIAKKLLC